MSQPVVTSALAGNQSATAWCWAAGPGGQRGRVGSTGVTSPAAARHHTLAAATQINITDSAGAGSGARY